MDDLAYMTDGVFRPDVLAIVDGRPRLIGSRCTRCGDVRFPRAQGCPHCHAPESLLASTVLPETGEVTTCCRIERGPKGFKPPYLVGYVQLPAGPRVLCQIEGGGEVPGKVIGKRCALLVGPLYESEGGPVLGYKFRVSA